MSENTAYEFKLKLLGVEIFSLNVSSTAASSKVIAAGTVFAVGIILVVSAYADKISSVLKQWL